jgi:hypothetical protein
MDANEKRNENGKEPKAQLPVTVATAKRPSDIVRDLQTIKRFFQLTGGSILYCLSAVLIIYGIVKLMGPVLSGEGMYRDALPCIFTLHVYELALLGVLILIVSRKVVDDAISIAILIALFLVGSSMALGSVADKNISASFYIGLVSIGVAFGKLHIMRRFARIPFSVMSLAGLGILVICNYLGPMLMARSIAVNPAQEPARRDLWLFLWLTMLIGAGVVLIEAIRGNSQHKRKDNDKVPFFQMPVMVYVFAIIVVVASGVHQYAMAFAFALERVLGDFIPAAILATLLVLEILRHLEDERLGVWEIAISCVPLAMMLLAIQQKSVLAWGEFGPGLLFYPPVLLALTGLAMAVLSWYHRWYPLRAVAVAYGLGVILTAGFSPEHPHDLNFIACFGGLIAVVMLYGMFKRNPYVCLAGLLILCSGLSLWHPFSKCTAFYGVTKIGGLAGVYGFGSVIIYLVFSRRLHKVICIIGALCIVGFMFDYLREYSHWRYVVVLFVTGLLLIVLWFRTRDIMAISILWLPSLVRLYILAKRIAYWRFIILSFLMLGAGAVVSLLKRPKREPIDTAKDKDSFKQISDS